MSVSCSYWVDIEVKGSRAWASRKGWQKAAGNVRQESGGSGRREYKEWPNDVKENTYSIELMIVFGPGSVTDIIVNRRRVLDPVTSMTRKGSCGDGYHNNVQR